MAWRPDVVHQLADRSGGAYCELKPITHQLAGAVQPRDVAQLARYDTVLSLLHIGRGDSWDVIVESGGSRGVAMAVPGLVKDLDGTLYSMDIAGPQGPAQLGLLYYELHPTGLKDTVPEWLKDLARELEKTLKAVPLPDWRKMPLPLPGPIPVPVPVV